MITCKSCGTEYEDFASYCNSCKQDLFPIKKSPKPRKLKRNKYDLVSHTGLGLILGILAAPFFMMPLFSILSGHAFKDHGFFSTEVLFLFGMMWFAFLAELMAIRLLTGQGSKSGGGLLPPTGYATLGYGFLIMGLFMTYDSLNEGVTEPFVFIAPFFLALVCFLAYEQQRSGWTIIRSAIDFLGEITSKKSQAPPFLHVFYNTELMRIWRLRVTRLVGIVFLVCMSVFAYSEAKHGLKTDVIIAITRMRTEITFADTPNMFYLMVFLWIVLSLATGILAISQTRKLFKSRRLG